MARERAERESEKVRAACKQKRDAMGIKMLRHLTLAEGKAFLATGVYPAAALAATTFSAAKRLTALPNGSVCMCCGADLSGKDGWIVEINTPSGKLFKTVCAADYEVVTTQAVAKPDSEPESDDLAEKPAQGTQAAPVSSGETSEIGKALQALTDVLANPPKVDKAEILAEAVKIAREEARGVMRKSVEDFIRDGATAPSESASSSPGAAQTPAKAVKWGVAEADRASSWKPGTVSKDAKSAVEKLQNFLSEFSFFRAGISMRLVNTFAISHDKEAALKSYCEVAQMEDLPDLVEKMKSPEFKEVLRVFGPLCPKEVLNKRFAVFYGAPGGGKTYAARKACAEINGGGNETIACHAGMDPADMLYAYYMDYATGRKGYRPTALLTAMTYGRAVVLDEVNLLPMESRMFLQDILDNKDSVHIMGTEIPIRDGFFVIGTMNLETGMGMTPLPLPLVDRASVVREFRTTVEQCCVGAGLC